MLERIKENRKKKKKNIKIMVTLFDSIPSFNIRVVLKTTLNLFFYKEFHYTDDK